MESMKDVAAKADAVSETRSGRSTLPRGSRRRRARQVPRRVQGDVRGVRRQPREIFGDYARQLYWEKPFDSVGPVYNFDMNKGPISIDWFQGGKTNICYNALDKHVAEGHGDDVAILWEATPRHEQSATHVAGVLDP